MGFGLTSLPGNPSSGPRRRGLPAPPPGSPRRPCIIFHPGTRALPVPFRTILMPTTTRSTAPPWRHRGLAASGETAGLGGHEPPINYNIGEVTLWNNCVATIPVRTVAPGEAAGLNSRRTMTEPIIGASRADGIPIRPRMSGVPMATTSNRTIARILRNLAGSRILPWRRTADPAPPALPGIPADRRPRTGTAGLGRSSLGKTCRSGRP